MRACDFCHNWFANSSATAMGGVLKFGMRHVACDRFVVSNFQGGRCRGAPSARANVGAHPPHRVNMGSGKNASAVRNRVAAMRSRANISRTGRRSDMGQTVLDRREMGLGNGMGFRALHAPRAKQDPPT